MADSIKRVSYFDKQFLRKEDFNAEQTYHKVRRRQHNSSLHGWGVSEGLEVPFVRDATTAGVNAGVAVDSNGFELVLASAVSGLDVSKLPDGFAYITATYQEIASDRTTDVGATGYTRWTESPKIEIVTNVADPSLNLVLARLTVAGGRIAAVDGGVGRNSRRLAGKGGADITAHTLTLQDPADRNTNQAKFAMGSAQGTVALTGSLAANTATVGGGLQANGALLSGALSAAGPISAGRLYMNSTVDTSDRFPLATIGFNAYANGGDLNAKDVVDSSRAAIALQLVALKDGAFWQILSTRTVDKATWLSRLGGDVAGNVHAGDNGGTVRVWDTVLSAGIRLTSDIRVKQDIRPLDDPLSTLAALRGVTYVPANAPDGPRSLGVIAQEVERVLPGLVATDSETGAKAVDYGKLTALLVEVYKALHQRVTALEEKLSVLKQARA